MTQKIFQKGKLFGSVNRSDIATALANQHATVLEAKQIVLDQPLKKLGKHTVKVQLTPSVEAALTVQIVSAKS